MAGLAQRSAETEHDRQLATLDGCVSYLGPKLQGKVLKVGA